MALQRGQLIQLWDAQEHWLGEIAVEQVRDDLVFGRFRPSSAFPVVEALFTEYVAAANQQLFSRVDELDAALAALGLHLRSPDGGRLPSVHDVQIGEGRVTFRVQGSPSQATPIEELEAMRNLAENWDGYGAAAPSAAAIDLAEELVRLFEAMSKQAPNPCVFHVSPTRTGGVLIEWEDRAMQHEVEISPDRSISFLHLDKTTRQIETRKFSADALPPGLAQELRHLVAA